MTACLWWVRIGPFSGRCGHEIENGACPFGHPVETETDEPPNGLCPDREQHLPHLVTEGSLAPFYCTANQDDREPYRSERRRQQN